jgi:uncharacterized 2Fe-2S/4Fe-4S cluster protein (DUF4445 family)
MQLVTFAVVLVALKVVLPHAINRHCLGMGAELTPGQSVIVIFIPISKADLAAIKASKFAICAGVQTELEHEGLGVVGVEVIFVKPRTAAG